MLKKPEKGLIILFIIIINLIYNNYIYILQKRKL